MASAAKGPKRMTHVSLDLEWHIDTLQFRCGCWRKDKAATITGTFSLDTLRKVIESLPDDTCFIGHQIASADLKQLTRWGIKLPQHFTIEDSLVASRLANPDWPTHKLKPLAREYGYEYQDEHATEDDKELILYCGKDVEASEAINDTIKASLPKRQSALLKLQNAIAQAFFYCEIAGIKLNIKTLEADKQEYESKIARFAPLVADGAFTDDGKMRAWLQQNYSEKELQMLGKTDGGEMALNVKAMKWLPRQNKEFHAMVDGRAAQDYLTLYVNRPLEIQKDGYLFSNFKHLVARTQRRSTEPAVQNWPEQARHCIVSRFPGGKIVSADFKNLEARLFAYEAGCKKLMECLVEGGYPLVAERVFGWTGITKQDPRYKALKVLVLAIQYNMGNGVYIRNMLIDHGIKKTWAEAEADFDLFFDKFPEMYAERERRKRYGWETGKAWSLIGAHMPLPILPFDKIYSEKDVKWRKKSCENRAINYPTQCNRYGTKVLMSDLTWKENQFLQVGDELVAFDEHAPIGMGYKRQWRLCVVEEVRHDIAEVFEVNLDNGDSVYATSDHLHLTCNVAGFQNWRQTQNLYTGQNGQHSRLVKLVDTWECDPGRGAGYLAGLLDGEGSIHRTGGRVSFSQNPGNGVVEAGVSAFARLGFSTSVTNMGVGKAVNVSVLGEKSEQLRALMQIRPNRLIQKWRSQIDSFGSIRARNTPRVLSVTSIGIQPIVRMRTSTATYIADGYATHNCLAAYVTGSAMYDLQKELSVMADGAGRYVEAMLDSRKDPVSWQRAYSYLPGIPIIEVHDELVADCPADKVELMKEMFTKYMLQLKTLKKFIPTFNCPLDVDITVDDFWK